MPKGRPANDDPLEREKFCKGCGRTLGLLAFGIRYVTRQINGDFRDFAMPADYMCKECRAAEDAKDKYKVVLDPSGDFRPGAMFKPDDIGGGLLAGVFEEGLILERNGTTYQVRGRVTERQVLVTPEGMIYKATGYGFGILPGKRAA